MITNLKKILEVHNCSLFYKLVKFDGSHPLHIEEVRINNEDITTNIDTNGALWQATIKFEIVDKGVIDLKVTFKLLKGSCLQSNIGVGLRFSNWSRENYVLMPSAVYYGNRFHSKKIGYPPILTEPEDLGEGKPTVITDVPRLNINEGLSRIQLLTRDMATPALGFRSNVTQKGFWMLTNQGTDQGDSGIEIEENADRSEATITLSVPGVRYVCRYTICSMDHPSEDRGADFKEGESVELNMRLLFFECPTIQELFDCFVNIRKDLTGQVKQKSLIPFYSTWKIQEEKYNKQNWEGQREYYSVGMRENVHQDWQVGWVGGMMATYPLLFEGSDISRERAYKNFDFLFKAGQDKSGFFHGCGHKGEWYGDNFRDISLKWHLVRKSADALYFLIKQFMLIEKQIGRELSKSWLERTCRCADAFVTLWKKNKQFGQFVNSETGDIIIGGSASAGIAPAGLALAGQYFGKEEYISVAKEAAHYFYEDFVTKGYTTGGPGEICQCPDSESAFGLLESYIVLYEVTEEEQWIIMAKDVANQCFTWCVSYNFKFPTESTFGRLGMQTLGSVYANVQNKHSSPGICTLSGDSLFKLFRATGEKKYLELIREIAHNMPQYLSRSDRPIPGLNGSWNNKRHGEYPLKDMPPGWMSERVQMSDWLEPVGEIFFGSCWCEVSNMLTYVEIPGLYVQIDTGFICVIDHIEARVIEKTPYSISLETTNPTEFKALVKVLVEKTEDMKKPLGQSALYGCTKLELEPWETKELEWRIT